MKAEIKGNVLVITLPIDSNFPPSKSGKTRIVATSGGNQPTSAQVNGRPVVIGVNAYFKE